MRGRPSGYGFHTKLTSTELEVADAQWPFALDTRGGSYTATSPIEIDGFWTFLGRTNAVSFVAATSFGGNNTHTFLSGTTLQLNSGAFFEALSGSMVIIDSGSFLNVHGVASFLHDGNVFLGDCTFSGGKFHTFAVGSTCNVAGAFLAQGTGQFTGPSVSYSAGTTVTLSGPTVLAGDISGAPVFTDQVFFLDQVNHSGGNFNILTGGKLVFVSDGHMVRRHRIGATSGTAVPYGILDADIVYARTLTALTSYKAVNTGCVGGEVMTFVNEESAHSLLIYQHDGVTAIAPLLVNTSGQLWSIDIWNDGQGNATSSWHVLRFSTKP